MGHQKPTKPMCKWINPDFFGVAAYEEPTRTDDADSAVVHQDDVARINSHLITFLHLVHAKPLLEMKRPKL